MMTQTRIKLSDNTLAVLDNFAQINQWTLFQKGNIVRVADRNDIYGEAMIAESFELSGKVLR